MVRILLAEGQVMMREALATLLALESDMEIVADVGRGDEVVEAALASQPEVALLDIEMPGCGGLIVATRLHAQIPTCRILILTTFGYPGYLHQTMGSSVAGFLLKGAPLTQLATAIRRALAGERLLIPN